MRAWSFDELAQLATAHTGKPLVHNNVSDEEFTTMLSRAGLPDFVVNRLVDINAKPVRVWSPRCGRTWHV